MDADVRPLHKKLEGLVFALDDPPVIGENGSKDFPELFPTVDVFGATPDVIT
jgi:uncharacterized protein with gpF-like domain